MTGAKRKGDHLRGIVAKGGRDARALVDVLALIGALVLVAVGAVVGGDAAGGDRGGGQAPALVGREDVAGRAGADDRRPAVALPVVLREEDISVGKNIDIGKNIIISFDFSF